MLVKTELLLKSSTSFLQTALAMKSGSFEELIYLLDSVATINDNRCICSLKITWCTLVLAYVVRFVRMADCGYIAEVACLCNSQHRRLHCRLCAGGTWSSRHPLVQAWNDQ